MAIKELFYDNRPQVLLDPRASQRIDPRFKFTRDALGTYVDRDGIVRVHEAVSNEPRFEYNPTTGELQGLLLEPARSNFIKKSTEINTPTWNRPVNAAIDYGTSDTLAPDGTQAATKITQTAGSPNVLVQDNFTTLEANTFYTISCFIKKGTATNTRLEFGSGGNTAVLTYNLTTGVGSVSPLSGFDTFRDYGFVPYKNGWVRLWFSCKTSTYAGPTNLGLYVSDSSASLYHYFWGAQVEKGLELTSLIKTETSAVSRAADLLSIEAPLPATGSVYIDARALTANENDTLLSLKNSSNDKIDLAYLSNASTYNSLALIANYDDTIKTSLPLPVPTTDRERNIITWGAQNYQYGRDSSRFAASLSSSVPTGLNQLSIGHDAVDPAKAFNGYINTVYAWSGELTPAVAEALVRNEIDAINADTYSPAGPAGSLALVINTQGTTASGEKTFTLPAESAANDNDIVITWGDGTESGLDGTDAEVGSAALTHTYPAAGIYPVWVEGQMQNIYYNNIANAPDLLQIAAWGTGDMFTAPSTMANAFYGCSQMDFSTSARTTNRPDTSAVQNWSQAFYNCSSITGIFPAFNFSAATNFYRAWRGCSSMASFVAAGDQTQNVTNFQEAWQGCSNLTIFPQINTSSATNFFNAWSSCSSLTSFPLINTAAGINFSFAWFNCSSLDNIVNAGEATSFPLIDTAAGTSFQSAWQGCSNLTIFPVINTVAGTNFQNAWLGCSSLTSFPLIDTSSATFMPGAWFNCSSLDNIVNAGEATSFPLIDTSKNTNFNETWLNCISLTIFPLINTSAGTSFYRAWTNCDGLTAFPALDFDSATGLASDASNTYTGFRQAWFTCDNLADFPPNRFNNTTCTRYLEAFTGCALTAASIENIIVSINAAGTSNGNLGLNGGTNAGASTWTAPAIAAYDALAARGWTITRNA